MPPGGCPGKTHERQVANENERQAANENNERTTEEGAEMSGRRRMKANERATEEGAGTRMMKKTEPRDGRLKRTGALSLAAVLALAMNPSVNGAAFGEEGDANDASPSCESAPLVSSQNAAYDADAILRALPDPGVPWVPLLTKYLRGEHLRDSEILSIDAEAVASADPALGSELLSLQQAIRNPSWEIEQPEQEEPSSDHKPPAAPEDEVPSSPAEGHPSTPAPQDSDSDQSPAGQKPSSAEVPVLSGPVQVGYSLTTTKFIAVIGEQARSAAQDADLYASVMIAQAIVESASGNSELSKPPYNNLFGIKGSYRGESVAMPTLEDDGTGALTRIVADFRSCPTIKESLADYVELLSQPLYEGARKSTAANYEEACQYLQGLYATDSAYAQKLIAYIQEYDLTRYDKPLDYEMERTYAVQAVNPVTGRPAVDLVTGEPVVESRTLVDLIAEATSHLGDDYVWGGAAPGAFDCSGLVQYSYRKGMGISLPRVAQDQYGVGEDVAAEDLHMGDLLFFSDDEGGIGHVAMYLGEGCYIEAPQAGDVVKVTSFEEKAPNYAKRLIPTRPVDEPVQVEQGDPSMAMDVQEQMVYRSFLGV